MVCDDAQYTVLCPLRLNAIRLYSGLVKMMLVIGSLLGGACVHGLQQGKAEVGVFRDGRVQQRVLVLGWLFFDGR